MKRMLGRELLRYRLKNTIKDKIGCRSCCCCCSLAHQLRRKLLLTFQYLMTDIKAILQTAIGTGELINIVYNGGSEPGKSRMILPIKIEDNKLRARCYVTEAVKVFNIDKITIPNHDMIDYTGDHKEPDTLQQAVEPIMFELKALSWDIELSKDSICLFSFFKNGKRRKTPDVSLSYFAAYTSEYSVNGVISSATTERAQPWYVMGHSFKYLSKAILRFRECAITKAPNNKQKL